MRQPKRDTAGVGVARSRGQKGFPNQLNFDSRLHLGGRCGLGRADRCDGQGMGDHRATASGGTWAMGTARAGQPALF